MQDDLQDRQSRTARSIAIQFLLGLMFGLLFILIPFSYFAYFAPGSVHAIHLWIAGGFVLVCGILSALVGKQFVHFLMRLVESLPPV
jgi:hypothetical protein